MKQFLICLIFSFNVFGAGDGHGSVTDLMWPAINFCILFSFLFYKLRTPLAEGYQKLSSEFESKFNSAKIAEESAKKFLEEQKLAKENASKTIKSLEQEHEVNKDNQRKVLESEYEQKTKKLYSDYENKLKGERKKVESQISSNLLESIIKKTSSVISGDPESKNKALKKFLQ